MDRDLELVTRHATDDDIAQRENLLQAPAGLLLNLVPPLTQALASVVVLDVVNVLGVDDGTVVGQQRRKRPSHDLRPVDDRNGVSVQAIAVGQDGVVDLEVLEDLDDGERGAGQDALELLGIIEEADVAVHVGNVLVSQALDVLAHIDDVLQVLVLAGAEDGVVDHDAVDAVVAIGLDDGILELLAVDLAKLVLEAAGAQDSSDTGI